MGHRVTPWRPITLLAILSCCASVSARSDVVGKFLTGPNQENIGEAQVTLPTSMRSGETVRISWEGVKAVTGGTARETGRPIIESGGDSVRLFLVVSNGSPQGFGVAQLPGAAEGDIIFGIQVPNVPGGDNFYDWAVPDLGGSFGNLFIAMESSPYELDLRGDDFYQIVFLNKYIVLSNEFQISNNGTRTIGWAEAGARPSAHRSHRCRFFHFVSPRAQPVLSGRWRAGLWRRGFHRALGGASAAVIKCCWCFLRLLPQSFAPPHPFTLSSSPDPTRASRASIWKIDSSYDSAH